MRIRSQLQLYFKPQSASVPLTQELLEMKRVLESLPDYNGLLDLVLKDIQESTHGSQSRAGRKGMTAEQILCALILKFRKNCSYRELSELTHDSLSAREFLKIEPSSKGFHYKTLQGNLKVIKESTVDKLFEQIKIYAKEHKIEDGLKTRSDASSIETNIHHPTDWSLMNDCIFSLTRIMARLYEQHYVPITFQNHYRASKSKLFQINNCHSVKKKHKLNISLIRICAKTVKYAEEAQAIIRSYQTVNSKNTRREYNRLSVELERIIPLAKRIVDVAHRRIVKGEKILSSEKVVSIFEPHTDIIAKGSRDVVFGHKATLTTGKSGLITDLIMHDGNPADSTTVKMVVDNHIKHYKAAPKSMVFDGCFNSDASRELLQSHGVESFSFSKEAPEKMTCSKIVQKGLRFFRAGIEASISMLKRMFGWERVYDKGKESFHKAVKVSAVVYNLFILARISSKT